MFVSRGPCAPHLTDNSRLGVHLHDPGMPIGVGREGSHSWRLSDVRALGPRLREDDGQGNRALFNARTRTARLDNEKSR